MEVLGKHFVWKTLTLALRSQGHIVLNFASSGIVSLLMPGGRTAHSKFVIPININEDSTCNIAQVSYLAEVIIKAKLTIWDEAQMMHKHCFEALDRSMRDLLRFVSPLSLKMTFGGKTVVLGGDFRQILPVIPKGKRQDIVGASINSSYLWHSCKVLKLTKNMRLQRLGPNESLAKIDAFSKWIANVCDGLIGGRNDGFTIITIPEENVLRPHSDPIGALVNSVFPAFCSGNFDMQCLTGRAILAPTLDLVHEINEYMSGLSPGDSKTYFSCDSVFQSDSGVDTLAGLHTTEFLNSLKCSGITNYSLTLKIGSPVMLLRNIDHTLGLCNGTRMVITKMGDYIVEAKVISGSHTGTRVLIPRLSLTPSNPRLPFRFQRRQFPLMLSYAMTINKCHGQSLTNVGLLLKKLIFVHGQLYVALSRVNNPNGLKVVIVAKDGEYSSSTMNVVYPEVFRNL